jgi:DNA-directed RNA polymerase specialized sigma24 family protein
MKRLGTSLKYYATDHGMWLDLQLSNCAFNELVKRHEPAVARTIIGMLGNSPEAEDVGQETFIRFYRSLSGFRGESEE